MNILDRIVRDVEQEVKRRLETRPYEHIRPPRPKLKLSRAISESPILIAEVKRASPSLGGIRPNADPLSLAAEMVDGGAGALSVLTERIHFQGDPLFLHRLAKHVQVPLLMKDFVIHPYQLEEAYRLGADAVLLIARVLDDRLPEFVDRTLELGMEPLVEVFDEAELRRALQTRAQLIGINNRDLATMRIDLGRTERLAPLVPQDRAVISESGIATPADVKRVLRAGARAVLVGTAIMRAPDIRLKVRELVEAIS